MRFATAFVTAILLSSGTALACSGTADYPKAKETLQQSALTPERKAELMARLEKGEALHEQGHAENDVSKMKESLKVLGDITADMH